MTINTSMALSVFDAALEYITRADLLGEIDWQRQTELENISETIFLRETAWVIMCSGFRESVVRQIFDHVSLCFCDWESADAIIDADPTCRDTAMASFGNEAKLSAITCVAYQIRCRSFTEMKGAVLSNPIAELQQLPFIGPITVWHLAKNLGLNVAKPDRHLARIASSLGFVDTHHFCTEVSIVTGEPIKVVDLVVWRYLADNPHARDILCA